MVRFSLYAIIPYILVCLAFGTVYSDILLTALGIFTFINLLRRKRIKISVITVIFASVALINCFNTYHAGNKPFCELADREATIRCVVDDMPSIDNDSVSFTAKSISAYIDGKTVSLDNKIMVYTGSSGSLPKYGDLLEFETKIKLPNGRMNDGGFDYRNYLNSKGIYALCNVDADKITNHGKYENVNPLLYIINSLREKLAAKCDAYMSEDASSFTKAFVLGYKGDMSENMKDNFSAAGISHIVAVSGLHLSIVMAIINLMIGRLKFKKRVYVIPVINIVAALFISAFTGFSPSVVRAALMLIISNCASLVRRENDSLQSLSFALLIILLVNPLAVNDIGLILSAMATLGIIILGKVISEKLKGRIKLKFIREIFAVTISAQVFTLPFMVIYFNSFSLYATLVNMLIVPMLPYLMGLIIIFLICPIAPVCWFMANGIWLWTSFILKVSEFVALFPFARVCIGFAKFSYIAILSFCAIWFIQKTITSVSEKKNAVYLTISCLAVMLILFQPTSKDVKITAINTGLAECTLIQLPENRTMLIDSGSTFPPDSAERIIIPYLLQNGVHKIDYAVISTFAKTNTESMISFAGDFNVGCIIVPQYVSSENIDEAKKISDFCKVRGIPLYMMNAGDSFSPTGKVNIIIHSPQAGYKYHTNSGSLVFELSAYGRSVLFTGDIDRSTMAKLKEFNPDIDADIIKLPYHDSFSIENENFLSAVKPSVAYTFTNNQYAEQKENVAELLSERDILSFQTADNGTIKFTIKQNGNIYIN